MENLETETRNGKPSPTVVHEVNVGVSRLKVGISRAKGERKWGGADAEEKKFEREENEETFGEKKREFWRNLGWRLYRRN